jgi:ATP-dependent Clp protease protease subunit
MNELQRRLADKKTIDIVGTINFDVVTYVREALMLLASNGSPDVLITINSPGGDADAGLEIYDMIRAYPGKTIGFALTRAGSAACTILQACQIRAATPNGKILIHHTKFRIAWDVLTDPVKRDEFIRTNEYYLNSKLILARRTNKDLDLIFKKCEDDTWIPSKEALEFGLLDQIVEKAQDINLS